MKSKLLKSVIITAALTISGVANASLITFYDTVSGGQSHYDATIAASSVQSDSSYTLTAQGSGNSWGFGDFTIGTASGSSWTNPNAGYAMTGAAINTTGSSGTNDIITFTFTDSINAFGFELGDWGTCCYPSTVRASFDNGAWVDIGTMTQASDNPNYDPNNSSHVNSGGTQGKGVFIGLIDDSAVFNTVKIDFTASGDFLYAGGTIKYSTFDVGGAVVVDNPSQVPEPTSLAILSLGLLSLTIKRKKV